MASERWIESASRTQKRPVGSGDVSTLGQHILNLARADAQREAEERARAVRAVRRMAGEDADLMLAMLGLEVSA